MLAAESLRDDSSAASYTTLLIPSLNGDQVKVNIECKHASTKDKVQTMKQNRKLLIYALGIFVCYFYFGILQEKM